MSQSPTELRGPMKTKPHLGRIDLVGGLQLGVALQGICQHSNASEKKEVQDNIGALKNQNSVLGPVILKLY